MNISVFLVDTFTSERFKGNPTSVCYSDDAIETDSMLAIAKELNFPVTAFVTENSNSIYRIRYFTPITEIPACGHATLAASAVIAQLKNLTSIIFQTAKNVSIQTMADEGMITLFYPRYEIEEFKIDTGMLEALRIDTYNNLFYCTALETLFIELETSEQLRRVQPDFKKLVASNDQVKEVVITAASEHEKYDYLLRSFCPWIGIDEDPVTGSVQAALAPYWTAKLGKNILQAHQASERGGEFLVCVENDKVQINGNYVFVMMGELML